MKPRVQLSNRALSGALDLPGWEVEVRRLEWDIRGGCSRALLVLRPGERAELSGLRRLLRCGVRITAPEGGACWWGYVHAIRQDRAELSLDTLANVLIVQYREERPFGDGGSERVTSWAMDELSMGEWGRKAALVSIGAATKAEAERVRDLELARRREPVLAAVSQATPAGLVELECRGWYETVGWQFFGNPRGLAGFVGGGAVQPLGENQSSGTWQLAQKFTIGAEGWNADAVWVCLSTLGRPVDALTISLNRDAGGVPGGVLGSASLSGALLRGEMDWFKVLFPAEVLLAAGTAYWLVLSRNGAADAVNYYRVSVDAGLPFAGGGLLRWNSGGGWQARVPDADMPFQLTGQEELSLQVAAMVPSKAQFLLGVLLRSPSTLKAPLYRTGYRTTREELEELLQRDDLYPTVSEDRVLVLERSGEPQRVRRLVVRRNGRVDHWNGTPVHLGGKVCGVWATQEGFEGSGGLVPGGVVLIRRVVWEGSDLYIV